MTPSSKSSPIISVARESPVFSRRLPVSAVPEGGLEQAIAATPAECAALARELSLPSIESLSASFKVTPLSGHMVRVRGEVRAAFEQVCVVTMETFATTLAEPIDLRFAPPGKAAAMAAAAAASEDIEAEDPPDPIIGEQIDLGVVAREFFALGLDPYPRKPGVVFERSSEETEQLSPFAQLAAIKPGPH
jgi:hypothetical protein